MLCPDPTQRPRIAGIRDTLTGRIAEAEREGWLGEIEGLTMPWSDGRISATSTSVPRLGPIR
jgi:hypothetical protein